jgi:hypothetical protein
MFFFRITLYLNGRDQSFLWVAYTHHLTGKN